MSAPLSHQISHDLVGHEDALRQVAEAFASGRMHHAWLLVGIEGIGKTSLAWHIANHVLSNGQNPIGKYNPQNRVTKLIQAEAHPDMLVVRRAIDEKTGELRNVIVVDDALKVASFLRKTSTHGGWRVVIIDEAHMMNRNGENAILKILEEPPAHALILITATTPGALLPTIRSRCRVLQLSPLDAAHMKVILSRSAPNLSSEEIDRLIGISGGSAGFALKIARTESLPLYEELESLLNALPALDVPRLHKLADQISRKADAESFEVVRTLLLDRVREAALSSAQNGADHALVERCLQVLDKISVLFTTADRANLDRKLAFIRAIGDIRDARI
jgi:DNA polymerase-3 subunit delta'